MRSTESVGVRTTTSAFTRGFVGQVVSTSPAVVRIGDLIVELDAPMPGGISPGETVQVVVDRVDI